MNFAPGPASEPHWQPHRAPGRGPRRDCEATGSGLQVEASLKPHRDPVTATRKGEPTVTSWKRLNVLTVETV